VQTGALCLPQRCCWRFCRKFLLRRPGGRSKFTEARESPRADGDVLRICNCGGPVKSRPDRGVFANRRELHTGNCNLFSGWNLQRRDGERSKHSLLETMEFHRRSATIERDRRKYFGARESDGSWLGADTTRTVAMKHCAAFVPSREHVETLIGPRQISTEPHYFQRFRVTLRPISYIMLTRK
jgi:hypothetical protein